MAGIELRFHVSQKVRYQILNHLAKTRALFHKAHTMLYARDFHGDHYCRYYIAMVVT